MVRSSGYFDLAIGVAQLRSLSVSDDDPYVIDLHPRGELVGRACFADGEPAVGATVIAFEDARDPWAYLDPGGERYGGAAEVDEAGVFRLQVAPALASVSVMVVGAGAYLPRTQVDLAAAAASDLEIECARARAVIATIQTPPGRTPFPEPGVGYPYTHVKRNIDLWGSNPMELPDALLRYYLSGQTSAHGQSPFEISAVLAQAGDALDGAEVRVDVQYPGYQPERFSAPFDLKAREPYRVALGLTPTGPSRAVSTSPSICPPRCRSPPAAGTTCGSG